MAHDMLTPPIAKRVAHTRTHQHWTLADHYAWLENKDDPAVVDYLEAENAYARAVLQHTEALQEQLYHEMRGRIKEDDSDAPQRWGDYFYYSRVEAGQQYRLFCRKRGTLDAIEEVLLDENALAAGQPYCHVFIFAPSPDHNRLAYAVDTTGAWVFDLYIKDLHSGELLAGPIANTAWTVAWASDNATLFYTLFDDSHRAYKLMRYAVGENPAHATLVYHESDDAFWLGVKRSRSGEYLLLTLKSHTTSEVHYLPADEPARAFQVLHPRRQGVEYDVEHHGNRFLIWTNEGAENFRLMAAPIADPAKPNWREIIAYRADTLIQWVSAFRSHLVVHERRDGLKQIRISDPDGVSNVRAVSFPEPAYTVEIGDFGQTLNPEFETNLLRFHYSSLVTPTATVDYDMVNETWAVKKELEIPSGYDPTRYESVRLAATAQDGARIPISLVFRKDLLQEGGNPLLLTGYGAYGFSTDPNFNTKRLSLLDRGFIFAIAHIRGGSELGRSWYEQGRLRHKKNSFSDFIACAEQLVAQGYAVPERMAILGHSAGGLLVSAVANMRPDLFKVAVAQVPFTNVITAMLMPELPLTVTEYEQWGHPDDAQAFEYMLSYSPYENVTAQAYPHIFATAGLTDLQVPYWDPAKWVAKLRAYKTDTNQLLLVTNMAAGHSGASGRYEHLREDAQIYAFLIDTLGAPLVAT